MRKFTRILALILVTAMILALAPGASAAPTYTLLEEPLAQDLAYWEGLYGPPLGDAGAMELLNYVSSVVPPAYSALSLTEIREKYGEFDDYYGHEQYILSPADEISIARNGDQAAITAGGENSNYAIGGAAIEALGELKYSYEYDGLVVKNPDEKMTIDSATIMEMFYGTYLPNSQEAHKDDVYPAIRYKINLTLPAITVSVKVPFEIKAVGGLVSQRATLTVDVSYDSVSFGFPFDVDLYSGTDTVVVTSRGIEYPDNDDPDIDAELDVDSTFITDIIETIAGEGAYDLLEAAIVDTLRKAFADDQDPL